MCKKLLVFALAFCFGLLSLQVIKQIESFYSSIDEANFSEVANLQSANINAPNINIKDNPQTIPETEEGRFFMPTSRSDEEVIDFFIKFQDAVARRDKKTVASMLEYPVCVRFAVGDLKRKGCRLLRPETFLKNYDKIFDNDFKRFIADIDVNKEGQLGVLWATWRGVTMDRGQIWFEGICRDKECNKSELKFTTLSSGFLERPYNENLHRETPK